MALLITWKDAFSVGIDGIDQEHKKLVTLINVLHAARVQRKSDEYIEKVVHELAQYAAHHFANEEKLLADIRFPKLDAHKAEHTDFILWLRSCRGRLASEPQKNSLSDDITNYLKGWLISHILNADKKYASFMQAGAARS